LINDYTVKIKQKNQSIPSTRIESWKQFRQSGTKKTIKNFILVVLRDTKHPLSCREISDLSGIEIQSLTRPLQELVLEKKISTKGRTKGRTKRNVIAYSVSI
jgi:hypothetical protein